MKISERIRRFLGLRGNFLPIVALELVLNVGWSMFEVVWQPYVLSLGATVSIQGGPSCSRASASTPQSWEASPLF